MKTLWLISGALTLLSSAHATQIGFNEQLTTSHLRFIGQWNNAFAQICGTDSSPICPLSAPVMYQSKASDLLYNFKINGRLTTMRDNQWRRMELLRLVFAIFCKRRIAEFKHPSLSGQSPGWRHRWAFLFLHLGSLQARRSSSQEQLSH